MHLHLTVIRFILMESIPDEGEIICPQCVTSSNNEVFSRKIDGDVSAFGREGRSRKIDTIMGVIYVQTNA